tara:strand:- start:2464 stop:3486 length:1023 start_codon:yes stop_codon:yes gene_type:complete
MKKIDISIIIPTWNRSRALIECISQILSEDILDTNIEIIVCDSHSTDQTNENLNNFIIKEKITNVKIVQCEENNVSSKRNIGILSANFDHIILLDDDCLPTQDYLKSYIEYFKKIDNRTIICGQYRTCQHLLKKSNYLKYRDSRNYKNETHLVDLNKTLEYKNIVTGNLGFKKDFILKNKILFNESIIGYGGEDVDWAWRLINSGFKIIKSNIKVFHNETSNSISSYSLKYFHYSFGAMPNLIKYNYSAASNLPFFFLENPNDKIIKKFQLFFIRALLNNFIIKPMIYFVEVTDKYSFCYISILYRVIILRAYIDGIFERKKNTLKQSDTKKDWYSKGYK